MEASLLIETWKQRLLTMAGAPPFVFRNTPKDLIEPLLFASVIAGCGGSPAPEEGAQAPALVTATAAPQVDKGEVEVGVFARGVREDRARWVGAKLRTKGVVRAVAVYAEDLQDGAIRYVPGRGELFRIGLARDADSDEEAACFIPRDEHYARIREVLGAHPRSADVWIEVEGVVEASEGGLAPCTVTKLSVVPMRPAEAPERPDVPCTKSTECGCSSGYAPAPIAEAPDRPGDCIVDCKKGRCTAAQAPM